MLNKNQGIHFYINISNMNEIIIDEEETQHSVTHSLHALDTYFTSIERFGKKNYPNSFVVEKITGSRLHLILMGTIEENLDALFKICSFAYMLNVLLNNHMPKYKTLKNLEIQFGASHGNFYEYDFEVDDYSEYTSIGYVANYSAKLQSLSLDSHISISYDMYENLSDEYKKHFKLISNQSIKKYDQTSYGTADMIRFICNYDFDKEFIEVRKYDNNLNLGEIAFSEARQLIDFNYISKSNCKKIDGIPLFADIRGFTKQFEKDDSNLKEMSLKTKNVLSTMYYDIKKCNGIHIQFQGDREVALFHNYPNHDCILDAITAAMRIVDDVKDYNVTVGVGASLGTVFASKIGARNERDNILLGTVVTQADKFEEEKAGENQIVINEEIYQNLKSNHFIWSKQFEKVAEDCYRTTIGYRKMQDIISSDYYLKGTKSNSYNGAWRR